MLGHAPSFTVHTWAATKQEPRRRRKHHKVFSGCTNCKKRRIRCDEGKPSCTRCLKGHHHCDYEPLKVWLFDPGAPSKSQIDLPLAKPPTLWSEPHQRALHHYYERAAPIFASHFGAPFWLNTVLQMSQSEPLVQDAVLTASLLIEGLDNPKQQLHANFYRSYNKAIGNFTNPALSYSIETVLTACSLFACFEFCLGAIGAALIHVRSGLQIAKDRLRVLGAQGRFDTPEARFLQDQVLPIMVGFALQARIFGSNVMTQSDLSNFSDGRYCLPQVPTSFTSPQQAHHCLAGIIHHSTFFESPPGCAWDWQLLRVLGNLLRDWSTALDTYERRLTRSQQLDWRPILCVLRCNHRLITIFLKKLVFESEVVRAGEDDFSSTFEDILSRLEDSKYLDDLDSDNLPTTEVEVLPMLFVIAIGSVQEPLQDRALRLLRRIDRREANWTAQEAAQTAEYLIRYAENAGAHIQDGPLVCLHVASLQWPLGQVLKWLRPASFYDSALSRCPCRPDSGQFLSHGENLKVVPEDTAHSIAEVVDLNEVTAQVSPQLLVPGVSVCTT